MINDLAVAYLIRSSSSHTAEDVFRALDLLERAQRDSTAPGEVLFNRALVLDRVGLTQESRRAWGTAAGGTTAKAWTAEARTNLDALGPNETMQNAASKRGTVPADRSGEANVVLDPQSVRIRVLDTVLPAWVAMLDSGATSTADSLLALADSLAAALASQSGDSSTAHAASQVRQMALSNRRALVAGVAAGVAGTALYRRGGDYKQARVSVESAVRLLARSAPAFAAWSEALLSFMDLQSGHWQVAEARWQRIAKDATRRNEWALAGRARWGEALSMSRRRNLGGAEQAYRSAADLFARARERVTRGQVLTQLGDVQTGLGRDADGMNSVLEGMRLQRTRVGRHDALIALGQLLQEVELPAAAAAAFREAVADAPASGRANDGVEGRVYLATALAESGLRAAAQDTLARARAIADSLPHADVSEQTRADLARNTAALAGEGDAATALTLLDAAAAFFATRGNDYVRSEVLLERARLALLLGDTARVLTDLASLAITLGNPGTFAGSEDDRRRQIAVRRRVMDQLLAIRLERSDTLGALRAYALLVGAKSSDAARFLTTPVPAGVTVALYALLPSQLVIWTKHGTHVTVRQHPVASERLATLTDRFVRLLRSRGGKIAADSAAQLLAQHLLPDVMASATPGDELVILADGVLLKVPFAALPVSERYLVEFHPVRYATSLATGFLATPRLEQRENTRAMVVGEPAHDRRLFPGLADLPASATEATTIAASYRHATLATASQATRTWVVDQLPRARMFHFAGHARISPAASEKSHLVLARAGEALATNVLYAEDIARLNLRAVGLVVLSSCGTTTQISRRVTATQSLSRTFLDAGAQGVVSSLWEADDAATQSLMGAFHRGLRAGTSASQALRTAQLEAIAAERVGERTRQWAAFRLDTR